MEPLDRLLPGRGWFEGLGKKEPWDAVFGLEPEPHPIA
jgi:hypothetical protein